jgi:DNA-binding IclR family transcriptional regulator
MSRTYRVPSVERAFRILEEISEAPGGLGLAEITERTGFPKTTVFMLLTALRDMGVLRQEGAEYFLGPVLAKLGGQALRRIDLRQLATPYMHRLVEQTGFTSHLGVLNGQDLIFVAKVESEGFIQFSTYPGMTQAFYLSSLGKAIAAFLPEPELDALLRECNFVRKTPYTITDADMFRRAAETIRRQGYAVEDEENEEGIRCIGAPVFDHDGAVVAAISVTAVRHHLPVEDFPRVAALVMEAANGLSREMGCSAPPLVIEGGGVRT